MKIVIVGAGNVGYTVARSLSAEGKDVVIVERNGALADRIEADLDVSVVRGNGARPAVLEKAGISRAGGTDADVLIACTDRDETNLMACWLAKLGGVPHVFARVTDMEFTDTPDWAADLGIDMMLSPERTLSREIASLLRFNAAVHSSQLSNDRTGSFAFRVEESSPICGMSLSELGQKYPSLGAVMVYVERGGTGFIPDGSWTAQAGDLCFSVALYDRVNDLQKLFDEEHHKRLSRVIIVGGGKLGTNLAHRLSNGGVEVTLVDKNLEKCTRLAREFPSVKVINGDGLDRELMIQLGVDKADGVVAATANDELNAMIACLANVQDEVKTIAVVRKDVYKELETRLPLDVMVNPNATLASAFLRYIRYPNSAKTFSLIDRIGAEMVEITIRPDSPVAGKRVMDLRLKRGIIIAVIKRGESYLVPSGRDELHEGDVISLFAMAEDMPEAMKFFGVERT